MDYKDVALFLYRMSWTWGTATVVLLACAYNEYRERKINLKNLLKTIDTEC